MTITYTTDDEETTVKLIGEVDHHTAKSAREKIDSVIYSETPKTLVLDMSSITFCDSSGLGLIIGRYKQMKNIGGELHVKTPTEAVNKIMNLSGLDKLIKIVK